MPHAEHCEQRLLRDGTASREALRARDVAYVVTHKVIQWRNGRAPLPTCETYWFDLNAPLIGKPRQMLKLWIRRVALPWSTPSGVSQESFLDKPCQPAFLKS